MNENIKNILEAILGDIQTLAQLIFETDNISNNINVNRNTLADAI